jgi:hypothetical protein
MQEPLIDPSIFAKVQDIYDRFPKTLVEVSTNGAALTEKTVDRLFTAMRDRRHEIWVSHHGIDKDTFEHIMKIDYDKALANVIYLIKASGGRFKIKVRGAGESSCTDSVYFTREQYREHWRALAREHSLDMANVEVDAFKFHDRAGTLHREDRGANKLNVGVVREIDPKHPFYCVRLDQWVHIMWDGTIRLCCMDYHGEVTLPNINQTSLLEYFHGPEYYELTEQISGRVGCKPGHICTRCVSPGG